MQKKISFISSNYHVSPWPLFMLGEVLEYHFHKVYNKHYSLGMIAEWRNRNNRMAVDKEKYNAIASYVLLKTRLRPSWANSILKKIQRKTQEFRRYVDNYKHIKFTELSNSRLWDFYAEFRNKYIELYTYAWLPNAIEGLNDTLSHTLETYIREHLPSTLQNYTGKYLSTLTTPLKPSFKRQEQISLLNIADNIERHSGWKKIFQKYHSLDIRKTVHGHAQPLDTMINKHHERFCWLTYDYEGPAKNISAIYDEIRHELRAGKVSDRLHKILTSVKQLRQQQRSYERHIKLDQDKPYAKLFNLSRQFLFWKDRRKDILYLGYYRSEPLFHAIANRLNLTITQVKHLLPDEVRSALINKKIIARQKLNQRIVYCIIAYEPRGMKLYSGNHAQTIIRQRITAAKTTKTSQFKGMCAYPGSVSGTVKIINVPQDISRMKPGNILVSYKTNPNLLPAMKIAGAIITEMGGITCHAAIVARELKIPCIVGARNITRACRDGSQISVHANSGTITLTKHKRPVS